MTSLNGLQVGGLEVLKTVVFFGLGFCILGAYCCVLNWLSTKIKKSNVRPRVPPEPAPYRLNRDATAAVSTDTYWEHDMTTCPRGVKVLMLGSSGVALLGQYNGDKFFVGWHALPRKRVA